MNLKQLKYFIAAAEEGSLTAAANSLGVAQPALSQQILNLEHSLDAKILERFPSGVKPNAAGERLLSHARLILMQTEEARRDVSEAANDISGEVKLAVPPTIARLIIPELLRVLATSYPDVRLNVIECDIMKCYDYLSEARVDFGITAKSLVGSDLNLISAFSTNVFLVGAVDNQFDLPVSKENIPLEDAIAYPIAIHTRPHSMRVQIENEMAQRSLRANWFVESDSSSIIRHYVAAGVAFAFLPEHAIEYERIGRELFARKIVDPVLTREYPICWPKLRPLSKAAHITRDLVTMMHGSDNSSS